jgi:hypothetical protein
VRTWIPYTVNHMQRLHEIATVAEHGRSGAPTIKPLPFDC